jgi:aerobic-type carbon monoxide dehydrogenase small subunit (CoxS/CutS family)
MQGRFRVNGKEALWTFEAGATLLDVLRENGVTEVKEGCREGHCGCCAVLLEGVLVDSCQVFAATAMEREITTSRGLGNLRAPSAVQQSFVDAGAVQCGFCTPGMVLATHALLEEHPEPTEEEIAAGLDGNLCRCTGYVKIAEAVRLASERRGTGGSCGGGCGDGGGCGA